MKKVTVSLLVALVVLVFSATAVARPGLPWRHRHLRGGIASIDASASTVSFFCLDDTTKTLTVTDKTRIRKNGRLVAFDKLDRADRGHAKYIDDHGTLKALKIFVHTPFMQGRVTATATDTVTLKRRGLSRDFKVDTATKIRRNGVEAALTDIKVGDHAKIYFNKSESGEFVARRIKAAGGII